MVATASLLWTLYQPFCYWWLILPIQNHAKNQRKWLKPWHMGTHMRVLSESYPINTNMTGFKWFLKTIWVLVLWTKVTSALKGLWTPCCSAEEWMNTLPLDLFCRHQYFLTGYRNTRYGDSTSNRVLRRYVNV